MTHLTLFPDLDLDGHQNACRIANQVMIAVPNNKLVNNACIAACNAFAQRGYDELFDRCTSTGDTTMGDACLLFWEANCATKDQRGQALIWHP